MSNRYPPQAFAGFALVLALLTSPTAGVAQFDAPAKQASPGDVASRAKSQLKPMRAIESAVAFLESMQRGDGRWLAADIDKQYPNALTALTTFTLRMAGVPPTNWRLQRVAAAFRDRSKTKTAFARACTLLMWCAIDPAKFKREVTDDVKYLNRLQLADGGWEAGTPTRKNGAAAKDKNQPAPVADPVTTCLALTGMDLAARSGIRVFPRVWMREQSGWLQRQQDDGGWGRAPENPDGNTTVTDRSDGIATASAIASLYRIYDHRYLEAALSFNGRFKARCGQENPDTAPIRNAISRGWSRLTADFSPLTSTAGGSLESGDPLMTSSTEYAYAVTQASLLSGRKWAGDRDMVRALASWLIENQQPDGSWGSVYDTCFAVLALVDCTTPPIVNKLTLDRAGMWHRDPRDATILARHLSAQMEMRLGWQLADLDAHPEDLFDAPLLILSGHEAPALSESQRKSLQDYVAGGGSILGIACCSKPEFIDGTRTLFEQVWPRLAYGAVDEHHPVWKIIPSNHADEGLTAFSDGCRSSIFLYSQAACCAWQQNLVDTYPDSFDVAERIVAYATFGRPPLTRVEPYFDRPPSPAAATPPEALIPTQAEGRRVKIARVKHKGDWWVRENAIPRFTRQLADRTDLGIKQLPPVDVGRVRRSGADVLWLTGHDMEPLRPHERVELKAFMSGGGTIIASACCGRETFDAVFRTLAKSIYGGGAWQRIDPGDPLMTGSFAPGVAPSLAACTFRPRLGSPSPARPEFPMLYGLKHKSRWAMIYSPYDVNCAIAGGNCPEAVGYRSEDAERIVTSALLYAARQKAQGN